MKWIGIKQAIMSDSKQMRFGAMMVLMLFSGILGIMGGYFLGTGTMPFVNPPETIIPTAPQAVVSRAETLDFITSDATNLVEYGEGYNCVEYALVLSLKGRWQGLPAMVIRVDFEGQPLNHLLVAYHTTDGGVIYFDPATDTLVYPRIGGELAGKKITGLYILQSQWIPYEVVK